MVTAVPPEGTPAAGVTAVTVGTASKLNWSALLVALVPAGVVTVTSTVPAASGAGTAVTWVEELTVYLAAAMVPNCTAAGPVTRAPMNPVPVMTTEVPPATSPHAGLTPVTVGAAS